MMPALNQFICTARHVIAQVVETEFVVGAVGDVSEICFSSLGRIGLMFVDAINGEAKKFKDGPVPFRVTSCEVIIHRNNMHASSRKSVKV